MREDDASAGRWFIALEGRRTLPRSVDEGPCGGLTDRAGVRALGEQGLGCGERDCRNTHGVGGSPPWLSGGEPTLGLRHPGLGNSEWPLSRSGGSRNPRTLKRKG